MISEKTIFSIIIPAYNATKFIEKCLLSVINQTFTNYEIIITNDGSTDNLIEFIDVFKSKHSNIKLLLINQNNNGIASARNTAIRNSNGIYLAFLDSDDVWYHNKLETCYEILKNDPLIDLLYHDEIEIKKNKISVSNYGKLISPISEDLIFNGNRISTSATIVKKEKSDLIGGFSENIKFNSAEDYDYWIRLAKENTTFFYLKKTLGEYHRLDNSITSRIEYHIENCFNVQEYHLISYLSNKESQNKKIALKILLNLETNKNYTLARCYYRSNLKKLAIKKYLKVLKSNLLYIKAYLGIFQILCISPFKSLYK